MDSRAAKIELIGQTSKLNAPPDVVPQDVGAGPRQAQFGAYYLRGQAWRKHGGDMVVQDVLNHPEWADQDMMKIDLGREIVEDLIVDLRQLKESQQWELQSLEDELVGVEARLPDEPAYSGPDAQLAFRIRDHWKGQLEQIGLLEIRRKLLNNVVENESELEVEYGFPFLMSRT